MSLLSKIKIGSIEYETVTAEVVEVDYKATNPEKLYTIRCKILHAHGSQASDDTVTARPIDSNFKRIPIVGEIVSLVAGPSSYGAAVKQTSELYYVNVYPVQSSVHHNALPGKHIIQRSSATSAKSYSDTNTGNANTNKEEEAKLDERFTERPDIAPLQPYMGDVLFESRFGSSIRASSTLKDSNTEWAVPPMWKTGDSVEGDPILVIRNGQGKPSDEGGVFTTESMLLDDSIVVMSSGQEVPFELSSKTVNSLRNLKNDTFETAKKKFSGNQFLAFSDRLVLNARAKEVVVSGKTGVALTTNGNITADAGNTIESEAKRINLGMNAIHPALLGDDTVSLLDKLFQNLIDLCQSMSTETHPTGFGPSGPPLNAGTYLGIKTNLMQIKRQLPELLSELVFLNKKSGTYTTDEQSYAESKELGSQQTNSDRKLELDSENDDPQVDG